MDKATQPTETLNDGKHVDILMIHALLESLLTIFSTMVNLRIQPGIPVPKQDKIAKGEVTGLMGMETEQAKGSVALSFTLPAIRKISAKLIGEEIGVIGDEARDMTGELTNMLVGGAKRIMAEKGFEFDMQSPQLLMGKGHEIMHRYPGQTVLLPIKVEKEEFYMELNFI